jgi:flagellar motor protein MotB
MQQAIDERDTEIRNLRTERASLKDELSRSEQERQRLEVDREEASMKLALQEMGNRISAAGTVDAGAAARNDSSSSVAGFQDLDLPVEMRDGNLVITLPSAVSFASGSASLSDSGKKLLDRVSVKLKQEFPNAKFHVEGHTDSDPISRSKFASNRELSIARALAVLTYLVESCRIDDEQFVLAGYGQYQPLASNSNGEGKAKNRRVEIVVRR